MAFGGVKSERFSRVGKSQNEESAEDVGFWGVPGCNWGGRIRSAGEVWCVELACVSVVRRGRRRKGTLGRGKGETCKNEGP